MILHPLKFSGRWGCSYGANQSDILLQLEDREDYARVRLSANEAEQIAETLWFMAAKARQTKQSTEEYQLKLFQRAYGQTTGRQLNQILMAEPAIRKQAISRLEALSGSRQFKFRPQHIRKVYHELIDGGLIKPLAKSFKRSIPR